MKKIYLFTLAVLALAACTKDNQQQGGIETYDSVPMEFKFSPYQMEPMKTQSSISTVCSRLDVYIIEQGTTDTMRFHQDRAINGNDFGGFTATLQTNKSYHLYAMAHNTTDTITFRGGIMSFAEDKIKQCLYMDTVFSPGDGLSLNVVMKRIVGMFKMRVTDAIPSDVTGFRFTVDAAGCKWNTATHESTDSGIRIHTINGTTTDNNGVATYNVYVMGDDMTTVKYVDITAEAMNATGDGEVRHFDGVPIRDGYLTTYTGTFFVTFGMGFTFLVGDWNEQGSYTF